MEDILKKTNEIKDAVKEVMEEMKVKSYENCTIEDILTVYEADFCDLMLLSYPSASIMMKKNYRNCGILIRNNLYNCRGIERKEDYFIAGEQELGFIRKSFYHMSDYAMDRVKDKLQIDEKENKLALRKGYCG